LPKITVRNEDSIAFGCWFRSIALVLLLNRLNAVLRNRPASIRITVLLPILLPQAINCKIRQGVTMRLTVGKFSMTLFFGFLFAVSSIAVFAQNSNTATGEMKQTKQEGAN